MKSPRLTRRSAKGRGRQRPPTQPPQEARPVSIRSDSRIQRVVNVAVDNAVGGVGVAHDVVDSLPLPIIGQVLTCLEYVLQRVQQARINATNSQEVEDSINHLMNALRVFDTSLRPKENSAHGYLQGYLNSQGPIYDMLGDLENIRNDAAKLRKNNFWIRLLSTADDIRILESIRQKVANWTNLLQTCDTHMIARDVHQLVQHKANKVWRDKGVNPEASFASKRNEDFYLHPGTRTRILKELTSWATNSTEEKRLLLLHGPIGTGKSSIALELSQRLDDTQPRANGDTNQIHSSIEVGDSAPDNNVRKLGSSYFFHCDDELPDQSRERFFITIAYQLAQHFPVLSPSLNDAIYNFVTDSPSMKQQFYQLILGPLEYHSRLGTPVVVIIDALDACRHRKHNTRRFRDMLSYLSEAADKVSYLRILISTRLHPIIIKNLSPSDTNAIRYHNLLDEHDTFTDIATYIQAELTNLWDTTTTPLTVVDYKKLAEFAEDCFQYARAIVDYLTKAPRRAQDAYANLIRSGGAIKTADLDGQYATILAEVFDSDTYSDDPQSLHDVRLVLAMLALAQCPLSPDALQDAIDIPNNKTLEFISLLGPLLHIGKTLDATVPLRPHHINFSRFLRDKKRCEDHRFHIAKDDQAKLASRLLATLSATDIAATCSSPGLQYASDYWISHLCGAEQTDELINDLQKFLKDHVDQWLAGTQASDTSSRLDLDCFRPIQHWCKENEYLLGLIEEAAQRVSTPATNVDILVQ